MEVETETKKEKENMMPRTYSMDSLTVDTPTKTSRQNCERALAPRHTPFGTGPNDGTARTVTFPQLYIEEIQTISRLSVNGSLLSLASEDSMLVEEPSALLFASSSNGLQGPESITLNGS
ncbi:hypothetical protein NM688_g9079 [Phlebia brevispora]|uniref:Uncharacterized protein n=1 Tax=Phlebia brevispora TaxID=194682 RepID=A0ACC1RLJ3_9APHY|nr:hypothetical protein NM688_g9079 [Phlebia brevispora]